MARVSPQQPPEEFRQNYDRYQVEGLDIYVQQGAVMTGPAVIVGLAGFWKFKWLTAVGVGTMSACVI